MSDIQPHCRRCGERYDRGQSVSSDYCMTCYAYLHGGDTSAPATVTENAALRAEVKRLRAALTEVIEAEEWPFSDAPPWGCALVRCYLALGREPGDGAPDELRAAYQSEKAAQEGGE